MKKMSIAKNLYGHGGVVLPLLAFLLIVSVGVGQALAESYFSLRNCPGSTIRREA